MRLFLLIFLSCLQVWALEPKVSQIQQADIVCSNPEMNLRASISTDLGKIWLSEISTSDSSVGVEAQGLVWQGIQSTSKFTGEVLGEIAFQTSPAYYISFIMREVQGKPELEVSYYEQRNAKVFFKSLLKDCELK